MRTALPSLKMIRVTLLAGSLSVLVAAAAKADDGDGSTVSFVDRETLTSNAWAGSTGNPLRSGSSTSVRQRSAAVINDADPADDPWINANSAGRSEQVVPASYDDGSQNGLQLRPYSRPAGLFSGGSDDQTAAQLKAKKMKQAAAAAAARAKGMPANGAAPNGMNPYGAAPQAAAGAQQGLPTLATRTASRAGSAQPGAAALQSGAVPASWQSNGRSTAPPNASGYRTATSAESYQHVGSSGGPVAANPTSMPGQPALASRSHDALASTSGTPNTKTAATKSRPDSGATDSAGGMSAAAQALAHAHKLAETANSEEDFSDILMACQRIPASQASPEEAAFGKQLSSWALNRRGQVRANAGQTKEAIADFEASIRLDSKRWRTYHNRGVLFAQSGQFEQAFDDFRHTIELNPQFAKAYSNRAALYVVAGQLEPAARDYEKAVTLDPKLAVAQRGCGRTLHMMGQTQEAMSHLDTAIRLAPNDASSLTCRGDLLTDLGRYSDAAADYDRAVELNSNSAEACRSSAWLLATCPDETVHNPQLALRRAQMAAKLDQKADAVTFDTLAAAQASAGDFRHAVESMRQAIELAPPSERSVYQDRMQMYRRSTPYRIAPIGAVQQAGYEQ